MAIEKTTELKPDVVVLSMDISEVNSIELIQHIKANYPDVSIIALIDYTNKRHIK